MHRSASTAASRPHSSGTRAVETPDAAVARNLARLLDAAAPCVHSRSLCRPLIAAVTGMGQRLMAQPTSRLVDAFLGLYNELTRHLRRRTGDSTRAEEVMQETYLRLLETDSRQQQEQIRDERAFIFRVAGNLAIDVARREQRAGGSGEPDLQQADPIANPERNAIAQDRLRQLDDALRELPANARLALLLFRVDGLSHAQIARRLGVSESMVAKYLAQALRHCRDRLGPS